MKSILHVILLMQASAKASFKQIRQELTENIQPEVFYLSNTSVTLNNMKVTERVMNS